MGGNMRLIDFIVEGGNVVVNDQFADRLDLLKHDRDNLVAALKKSFIKLNKTFLSMTGKPLWHPDLLKNNQFFAGSSAHLFNPEISSEDFLKHKSTIGDVDVQVDKELQENIILFFDTIQGKQIGELRLLGYKKSPSQIVTLWRLVNYGINLQIDFELVDFENNRPSEWAQFSHSAAWKDIKEGIKGVFHKYLIQAIDARHLRDVILLTGKKETPKQVKITDLAFSVAKGMRVKYTPVKDETGKQKIIDGLPVFKENPTETSNYLKNKKEIFKVLFKREPKAEEISKLDSFVDLSKLIAEEFTDEEKSKILLGFAYKLWGPKQQRLYRGEDKKVNDLEEKTVAFKHLVKMFNVDYDYEQIEDWIKDYYESYK